MSKKEISEGRIIAALKAAPIAPQLSCPRPEQVQLWAELGGRVVSPEEALDWTNQLLGFFWVLVKCHDKAKAAGASDEAMVG